MLRSFSAALFACFTLLLFGGCETTGGGSGGNSASVAAARSAMNAAIAQEPKGAYYVGRRLYKVDYKVWGHIRRSGEPWSTAKLVMMNENVRLAPDRMGTQLGTDNGYEYKLTGEFSGDTVYEPASNGFYPEFVLRGAEVLSRTPAPIYRTPGATDPERRVLPTAY
jgi:hypothetical protein